MVTCARLYILLVLCLVGCKDDKKPASPAKEEARACETNTDCEDGWVCLDNKCADSSKGAIYEDPQNAVTPDKVKKQMENVHNNNRAQEYLEE